MVRAFIGFFLALILLGAQAARAQFATPDSTSRTLVGASWEMGIPAVQLTKGVSAVSFTGVQVEVRRQLFPRLSIGCAGSWNWFHQDFNQTTDQQGQVTVTGPAYRRANFWTVRATAHYYLTEDSLQPFLGLGLGGAWSENYRSTVVGSNSDTAIGIAIDPQAGVLWAFHRYFSLCAQVHYQFTSASFWSVKYAQWIGLQTGLMGYF